MAGSENIKKQSVAEFLAKEILDSNNVDTWERLDLGEKIAIEIDKYVDEFKMTEFEYSSLIVVLDAWAKDILEKEIQEKIDQNEIESEEE